MAKAQVLGVAVVAALAVLLMRRRSAAARRAAAIANAERRLAEAQAGLGITTTGVDISRAVLALGAARAS